MAAKPRLSQAQTPKRMSQDMSDLTPHTFYTRRKIMKIPQVSVFVQNRPGRLQAVCRSLADAGINLLSLTLADSGEFGLIRLIVNEAEKAVDVLAKAGLSATVTDVVACPVADKVGGLADLLDVLGDLQIDYMYAYPSECATATNIMILRFSDTEKALKVLEEKNFKTLSTQEMLG